VVLIKFIDPADSKNIVGASDGATVTFKSGHVVYGPKATQPPRLRKTETVASGELHESSAKPKRVKRKAKAADKK